MRKHLNDSDIQACGCRTLKNLAFGNQQHAILQAGGDRAVLTALSRHSHHSLLQQDGYNLLRILKYASVQKRRELFQVCRPSSALAL